MVRFSSLPLVMIAITIGFWVLTGDWFIVVLWGPLVLLAVLIFWRPFRLASGPEGPRIEYFKGLRWFGLSASEITALRYEHGPLDGRGRALIRADTIDGGTARIPGTAGIYWFRRAPDIPTAAMPHRRLHVVSTIRMLALVSQRLNKVVDTYDAISMNPRR